MPETTLPALASVADLATLTGKPATDAKLLLALKRASARFRGAVGHPVSRVSDDVVLLDGDGSRALLLPAAPVIGTTAVEIDGVPITDYRTSAARGILRRPAGWPDDLGNVQVTYSHGYDQVPGDIEDAVLEQAELQYKVLAGVQQASLGAQSVTFGVQASVGVTQRWAECVARYQLKDGRS
ncbi:hypothetical protein [Cryobacterium sp. AP23]